MAARCIAEAPDSMFTRLPVFVRATAASKVDTAAGASLLLVSQDLATRIRGYLGSPDTLSRADSLVRGQFGLESRAVRVTAHRSGAVRWRAERATPATALLERALTEAQDRKELFLPDDAFTGDTLAFTLGYVYPHPGSGGRWVISGEAPDALLAFSARIGREQTVTTIAQGPIRYPDDPRVGFAEGRVILEFVVDTTGRADPATVRDLWPSDRPRLTGALGEYYEQFRDAARGSVTSARFRPASIAGCKVRQLVQQPFTYRLRR